MPRPLVVLPHKFIPGIDRLDAKGRPLDAVGQPVTVGGSFGTWGEAYATDAHCVAYAIPGVEGYHPRINKRVLPTLVALGRCPLLHWAIVDVDNPDHGAWESPSDEDLDRIAGQVAAAGLPEAGVYLTRGGYRLVWPWTTPVEVGTGAEAMLSGLLDTLAYGGIEGDRSCTDWTRVFRMPRATRDGRPEDLPRRLNCLD